MIAVTFLVATTVQVQVQAVAPADLARRVLEITQAATPGLAAAAVAPPAPRPEAAASPVPAPVPVPDAPLIVTYDWRLPVFRDLL